MSSRQLIRKPASRIWLPLILGGILGLSGYMGPWVPHHAEGLVVHGLDLGEYVKFLPQVISGQIGMQRELFYLPLFAGSLIASLIAGRRSLPRWLRTLLALAAVPLALAMLPPAWSPATLRLPEFRLQILAILFCLAMIPALIVTRYLPDWLVLVLIALLAIPTAVLPAWALLQVRPAITPLYRSPLPLGWGFWTEVIGFLFVAFWAIAQALTRIPGRRE